MLNHYDPREAEEFFEADAAGTKYAEALIEVERMDGPEEPDLSSIGHILNDSPDVMAHLADFDADLVGFLHAAFLAGWCRAKGVHICDECGWVGTKTDRLELDASPDGTVPTEDDKNLFRGIDGQMARTCPDCGMFVEAY